jgi:hypothetical protein
MALLTLDWSPFFELRSLQQRRSKRKQKRKKKLKMEQGDQIGRIFAYWAIVYFGHFLNFRSSA